jgi:hypothetical protein
MALVLVREDGTQIKANLDIFKGADWTEVVVDSAGGAGEGAKNPEYAEAVEAFLSRLASLNALLIGVVLNSRPVADISLKDRVITLDEFHYPVQLSGVRDYSELRKAIASSSARQLSDSAKGGNPRRRLSLVITFPQANELEAKELISRIGAKQIL